MLPFAIRDRLRWRGRAAPLDGAPAQGPRTPRESELWQRYGLERWKYPAAVAREALGTLDLLDRLGLSPAPVGHLLDVGAKNWSYLPALIAWLGRGLERGPARITGVEIDAYRLYSDFRSRISHASAVMELARASSPVELDYLATDARELSTPVDAVTWLFPFLDLAPHRAWGLPRRLFDPAGALAHVLGLLRPGGWLAMANQGEWERCAARELMERAPFRMRLEREAVAEGSLHASPYSIFLTLWIREE